MDTNKKDKVSFADAARKIQSKYKRAKFDKLEKEGLEKELEALMAEQEAVRTAMGLNEQPQQQVQQFLDGGFIPYGINNIVPQKSPEDAYLTPEQLSEMGKPLPNEQNNPYSPLIAGTPPTLNQTIDNQLLYMRNPLRQIYDLGDNAYRKFSFERDILTNNQNVPSITPNTPATQQVVDPSGWNAVVDNIALSGPVATQKQPNYYEQLNNNIKGYTDAKRKEQVISNMQNALNPSNTGNNKSKSPFWDKNKQYLPYAISGLSNIAGNLLLANMAKKNTPQVSASLATPERMNLEPQAEQLRKDAVVSKNIGMRQARDLGLNAGATLANMGVIGSGVDRQLGANLTNLYGQQEQFNVGTANQFVLQNQDAINRANLINSQYQAQTLQNRLGLYDDIAKTLPGVLKDIRMDKADKEMRDALNAQAKNSGGKNYYAVGDLFSKEGLTYRVKEVDTNGNPTKTELVKDKSTTDKKYQELLLAPKITFQKQKFNTNRN